MDFGSPESEALLLQRVSGEGHSRVDQSPCTEQPVPAAEGWLREGGAISHKSLCSLGTLEASPWAGMARPRTAAG